MRRSHLEAHRSHFSHPSTPLFTPSIPPHGYRMITMNRRNLLKSVAAASLGQVHRATLPNGADVACKLQYPDMASTVEADLRQFKIALAIFHRMDNALNNEEAYK